MGHKARRPQGDPRDNSGPCCVFVFLAAAAAALLIGRWVLTWGN